MVAIPVGDRFQLEGEARIVPGADGVVVCHPHPAFGGRMDTPLVIALADALHAAGLSTLRFNFRGVGGSGGRGTGGHHEHEDVRAACAFLRSTGARHLALAGYSFGALMAVKAIAQGEPAWACAAVGFPSTILGETGDRVEEVERVLGGALPFLFVSGDRDPFSEVDRLRAWAAAFPSVRCDVLPGAGHFFEGAQQTDAVRRVADFIRAPR